MNLLRWKLLLVMAATGLTLGGAIAFVWFGPRLAPAPAEIAAAYERAIYAHDTEAVWSLASEDDQKHKPRDQYLAENPSYTGLKLELARRLAEWIEFTPVSTSEQNGQIIVAARLKTPDVNQPEIQALLAEAEIAGTNRQELFNRLQALRESGNLKWIERDGFYTLVNDRSGLHLSLHWSGAVLIKLEAYIRDNLPFEFYPVKSEISAWPGETRRTAYVMKNLSDKTITVKALHSVLPEEYKNYLTLIQCFCFTEHTLQPGETLEAPLILRVDFNAPSAMTELVNRYDLYSLESFPAPTPLP